MWGNNYMAISPLCACGLLAFGFRSLAFELRLNRAHLW